MTTPAPGGRPSPLRIGGLALIGVAVVAAIIGLTSLAGGGSTPTAAPTDATPTVAPPPEPAPPPAPLPGEQVPPGAAPAPAPPADDVPVPPIEEPPPAERPGGVPPGQPAPAPDAPAPPPGPEAAPQAPAPGPAGGAAAPAPAPNGAGGGARAGDASGNGAGKGGTSSVRAPLRVYNNSTISGLAARAAEEFRRQDWTIDEVGNYPHGIIPTSTVYFRPGTDEEEPARVLAEQFGMRVSPRFEGLEDATPGIIVIVTRDYGR